MKVEGSLIFLKAEKTLKKGEHSMSKKIYVGNISFKATDSDIRELFSQFGEIESINMITDSMTGKPKGFGFVEMASEESAKKAISTLNGSLFMDRTLSVAEAKPQQSREKRRTGGFEKRRGGFGGGRGHSGRR